MPRYSSLYTCRRVIIVLSLPRVDHVYTLTPAVPFEHLLHLVSCHHHCCNSGGVMGFAEDGDNYAMATKKSESALEKPLESVSYRYN